MFLLALLLPAQATDTWSEALPGVQYLYRTESGPKVLHFAFVDLSRDELYLRSTRPDEAGRTTSSFASTVGAAVAINGDWFEGSYDPVGLAVGQSAIWTDTSDTDAWSFIACPLEKDCHIDPPGTANDVHWRWRSVVGANGSPLVVDGVANKPSDSFYSSDRHPRSAIGLTSDGKTLIFAVGEGRRSDAIGMTFNEMADQMVGLGAYQAVSFDGGGSSALVIDGSRVSNLPSGESERSVANHFAVVRSTSSDARCEVANGRWCLDATWIAECEGGEAYGEGDCGVYGSTCEVHEGIGYCSEYRCTNGGNETACLDGTNIATCELGRVVSEGDCAYYGATCEDGGGTAYCVDYRCAHGGNAAWCLDGANEAACVNGVYSEAPCDAGESCASDACVDPDAPTEPDTSGPAVDSGDTDTSDGDGGWRPGWGDDSGPSAGATLGERVIIEEQSCLGCAAGGGALQPVWLALALLWRRRSDSI